MSVPRGVGDRPRRRVGRREWWSMVVVNGHRPKDFPETEQHCPKVFPVVEHHNVVELSDDGNTERHVNVD